MFYCPFHIWDSMCPIDSYFSEGLKPPTSIIYPLVNYYNYGKSPCLMAKSTISMAIFNRLLCVYQRVLLRCDWTTMFC